MLVPTPAEKMCDAAGRPYFLWDCDLDVARFRELIRSDDLQIRAHYMARMMRQAKPDDVFEFITPSQLLRDWEYIAPLLGRKRPFWTWLVQRWQAPDAA